MKKIFLFISMQIEVIMYKNYWLNRFRVARYVRRYFLKIISKYKTNYVEIEGRKMFLDKNDSLKLSLYPYFFHDVIGNPLTKFLSCMCSKP